MVALNIVYSKNLLEKIPSVVLMELRFVLATIILFVLHWVFSRKPTKAFQAVRELDKKSWFYIFAQALTAGVGFNFFMLYGLKYTSANAAGIITSALPALIALFSCIILREVLSMKKALSVAFATLGLLVIAMGKIIGISASHTLRGDLFIFLALCPETFYYILCKLHATRLPVFFAAALMNGINVIASLFFFILFPVTGHVEVSLEDWLILSLLGLFSGLFYAFWLFGSKQVDGITASLSTAFVPVWTVLLAWGVLGERLTLYQGIGMSLVMLSILLYSKQ